MSAPELSNRNRLPFVCVIKVKYDANQIHKINKIDHLKTVEIFVHVVLLYNLKMQI
jgi:hypothetical protein